MAATESTGIVFGVENHGKTTNDPEFLDALFAGVGSNNDLNIEDESLGRLPESERAAALAREIQYLKRYLASA